MRRRNPSLSELRLGVDLDLGSPTMGTQNPETVQKALAALREADSNSTDYQDVDPAIRNALNTALANIWRRIEQKPDSYIMTDLEFSIFNRFRHQYRGIEMARLAVERYWNHVRAEDR